jgi:polysaccharide deacetylase family protein (PEP-CTERM system associated)
MERRLRIQAVSMAPPAGTVQAPERTATALAEPSAMSVDVEDYFHVSAFRPWVNPGDWDRYPLRLERNLRRILDLFDDAGVRATFFWLGWAAERLPLLVREVSARGHELASHGYGHVRVHEQTPAEFRADVARTRTLLEDLSGRAVIGYRAASFSIDSRNLWALDELLEAGYRYSSSINPIRHDHYGMREAPRFAFRFDGKPITEIPITTLEIRGMRWPCGGGGFFRLLPYRWSRWALGRVRTSEGQPAVFYFHPWEIDPEQPRVPGIDARARFRHYVNLNRFEGKLQRLLGDFRWAPLNEVFAAKI